MADEINEQMAQPIGPQMDEDELNAELEEMENELMDSQLLAAPDVPVSTVKGHTRRRTHKADNAVACGGGGLIAHSPALVCVLLHPAPAVSSPIAATPAPVVAASAAAAAPAPAPQRQVVMAGGGAAPAAASASSSNAKKLSAKEQNELKELEALMGM